mmetsp:Transcript_17316/g.22650  ORF Transcript_17316/g.22650 Transcript_17316/m.22650 type:complete len:82 (+) Transcript_17316:527-772(+)
MPVMISCPSTVGSFPSPSVLFVYPFTQDAESALSEAMFRLLPPEQKIHLSDCSTVDTVLKLRKRFTNLFVGTSCLSNASLC